MRGGDEADGAADSIRMHLLQRVRQVRMPVAHPDVDRQRVARVGEARPQPVSLTPCELGNRRNTGEQLVMMRDLFDTFGRDPPAAEDVCEERTDIVAPLRATERYDEDSVKFSVHGTLARKGRMLAAAWTRTAIGARLPIGSIVTLNEDIKAPSPWRTSRHSSHGCHLRSHRTLVSTSGCPSEHRRVCSCRPR